MTSPLLTAKPSLLGPSLVEFARSVALAALAVCLSPGLGGADGVRFTDRSATSNLDRVTWSGGSDKAHILETTGNGVLSLDYDGDGYQDLFLVAAFRLPPSEEAVEERSALYRNNGDGTFVDVSHRAGLEARFYGHGGCVGDPDADGHPDLYITAFGPNLLFRNVGDGTFREVGLAAGVADPHWSIGCTFFDADGDGDQDLFVGNYVEATWTEVLAARRTRMWRGKVAVLDGPRGLEDSPNSFYRNNGDGTFSDDTLAAGLRVGGRGYTMAVASFDYDNDGDVDLYVANDSYPNRLYRNTGEGVFEEVGMWAGVAYSGQGRQQGSMGVGVGDLDGNGWLDLIVTNFTLDHYTLYQNLGHGVFRDESFASQVATATFAPLGWAAIPFDADNDRDLDLFFANGHIYPQVDEDPGLGESYRQLNQLLLNDDGRFREVGAEGGSAFSIRASSRGAAAVDLDNDGDLDLVVSNQDAPPSVLENVSQPKGQWLTADLRQSAGSRRVLGARVALETDGKWQIRETTSGGGYASENDPRLHWGLAAAAKADSLRVAWPGGRRTLFKNLPANRLYIVVKPGPGRPAEGG